MAKYEWKVIGAETSTNYDFAQKKLNDFESDGWEIFHLQSGPAGHLSHLVIVARRAVSTASEEAVTLEPAD